jgi:hypothetical protein
MLVDFTEIKRFKINKINHEYGLTPFRLYLFIYSIQHVLIVYLYLCACCIVYLLYLRYCFRA